MEIVFLILLVVLMIIALTSGFPVAFALPGSAIATIALAAACGYLVEGDVSAYFAQDGPDQWLSAGVTNFRSLYWEVERDTLIAIPLFVFMGIMLQRSKIAEDLLVAMAQLFGPIPGGLGISVVFVGALLAATTGIVGATVIAMGLISLPAMLRNNYSKPLATGTICASGTLGQIIPPSIVLIILADQLSSAADQANTARKADYKQATGELTMPSEFDVTSASAGDMFMGAFIPGLVLVGLYMLYILIQALIRPNTAPPVPYDGNYDNKFFLRVALALIPPLALIFAVLGSIIMGIATVNQAGAIGAMGAMIMAGYRLMEGKKSAYIPAVLALTATVALLITINIFDLNVKNIKTESDQLGILIAAITVTVLLFAIGWSAWRAYRIDNTLNGVMIETAKTTSMVFIILIGAAMLTSAFRAFGGEELVKHFLTGLPGGFWSQFLVVMAVIFLLGFFLDFIEIAVVVVPIVAPILLADPSANITAVWLGVMVGLNIQTSFLTPPFGFALFYLRGVAPKSVKTTHIYAGAAAFIVLQLVGLAIAGYLPPLVNYLPNRTYLTSETAPPPKNPRLQHCLEQYVFPQIVEDGDGIRKHVETLRNLDVSYLPENSRQVFAEALSDAENALELVTEVTHAREALAEYETEYKPLHQHVRRLQASMRQRESKLKSLRTDLRRQSRGENPDESQLGRIENTISQLETELQTLTDSIPRDWQAAREKYTSLAKRESTAVGKYRRSADGAYEPVAALRTLLAADTDLAPFDETLSTLQDDIADGDADDVMAKITLIESALSEAGASSAKTALSKSRRALKGAEPDREKSLDWLAQSRERLVEEIAWRERATDELLPALDDYDSAIKANLGLRSQNRLTTSQAKFVARCQSSHRDISLSF